MKAESCRLVLRPRDPLATFDLMLVFLRADLRRYAWLFFRTVLPCAVGLTLLEWASGNRYLSLLVLVPLLDVVQVPFTALGGRLLFATDVDPREGLRATLGRATLRLLAARLLVWPLAACTFGMPLLLAPGVTFLPETLILERGALGAALRRASRLGGRDPLASLAASIGRLFLTLWMAAVMEAGGQAVLSTLQLGRPAGYLLDGDLTPFVIFGLLAAQPVHALYRLLLYVQARTLAEGWDVQVALWGLRKGRGV